jgi:hypothetical protein
MIVGRNFERPLPAAAVMMGAAYLILVVTLARVGKNGTPHFIPPLRRARVLGPRMDKSFRHEAFGGRLPQQKTKLLKGGNV